VIEKKTNKTQSDKISACEKKFSSLLPDFHIKMFYIGSLQLNLLNEILVKKVFPIQ